MSHGQPQKFSRRQMNDIFFSFFPRKKKKKKKRFDSSCKLFPVETICMNCQIIFSEKMFSAEFFSKQNSIIVYM